MMFLLFGSNWFLELSGTLLGLGLGGLGDEGLGPGLNILYYKYYITTDTVFVHLRSRRFSQYNNKAGLEKTKT